MSTKVRQSVKVQLDSASERRKASISNKEHEVKIRRSDMAAIARVGLFVIAIAPIGAFLSAPLLLGWS